MTPEITFTKPYKHMDDPYGIEKEGEKAYTAYHRSKIQEQAFKPASLIGGTFYSNHSQYELPKE